MGTINCKRVLLGGLLAGLVVNVFEFVVNGVLLKDDWAAAMQALGKPSEAGAGQMVILVIAGFLMGIFALWLYAAIRPCYGPGPNTALIAGVAVWIIGGLLPMVYPIAMEMFPYRLAVIGLVVSLVEYVGGTVLGASVYQDAMPATRAAAAL